MKAWRIILAIAGIGLALFGVFRLATEIPTHSLFVLALWMLVALAIHDGVLSPAVVAVSRVLRRHVPDRGRRYLQIGLIMGTLITVIALPMIFLRGSQPAVKALLLRNYGANLSLLIGIIAVITLTLYAVHVAREGPLESAQAAQPSPMEK
ncbi:MAG TPA: hypothetical protein VHR39_16525 [Propionibacteriaceae bacterium]|jgi:hypothetical protein|nr:hypothetical protein [Propionibacteriaceae bacterium]